MLPGGYVSKIANDFSEAFGNLTKRGRKHLEICFIFFISIFTFNLFSETVDITM